MCLIFNFNLNISMIKGVVVKSSILSLMNSQPALAIIRFFVPGESLLSCCLHLSNENSAGTFCLSLLLLLHTHYLDPISLQRSSLCCQVPTIGLQ